ncbi:hemolysin family protein [Paenibacillus gallinarum]|uniref:HlyC/CorC family transporter n=1 Tax=Paenibacillus gallinarum TaxID=2762232 RepID=A0ABR8SZV3_9BACL|nr:hemolysin family protein [Paenibacillus gallinarum]MBD7969046.1 HlyC/CorC family transporter [Paenibacillus gallinarum]
MGFDILVILILLVVNAFFAASEMALISINDNRIRILSLEGNKRAQKLEKLLEEPTGFLSTIQIGITLAGFLNSAFAADKFASLLVDYVLSLGVDISPSVLSSVSVIVITLILSYFTLVFGELVPKRIAMKKAEAIALAVSSPLSVLSKVVNPFVKLLTVSTNLTVRLFGIDPNAEDEEASEEEIRMLVDTGLERGTIQQSEKMIIHNIFDFDNKDVSDMMTHRTDMIAISADTPLEDVLEIVQSEQYTRFPVFEERVDNIIGILHVKDLIVQFRKDTTRPKSIMDMIRPAYFVSESKKGDDLLEELQQNRVHMAIVVDEYGGTAGLITIEDLIEEIVGSIYDEYDEEESIFEQVDEDTYIFTGIAHLDEVSQITKASLPEEEYDTLSGFMVGTIGRIPTKQERPEFEFRGFRYKVLEVGKQRIRRIQMTRLPEEERSLHQDGEELSPEE